MPFKHSVPDVHTVPQAPQLLAEVMRLVSHPFSRMESQFPYPVLHSILH